MFQTVPLIYVNISKVEELSRTANYLLDSEKMGGENKSSFKVTNFVTLFP